MKNIDPKKIEEAVAKVDLRKPQTIQEAANAILTESEDVTKPGATVGIIEDPTYPYSGAKAKVIGPSNKGGGFVDVEFENGTRFPVQSDLLFVL